MGVKSRRQEYAEQTRNAVLEAAARQFAERGFRATTIDDVAQTARIAKGTVYYHFANKAQLFEAVFRDGQTHLLDRVVAAVDRCGGGPWERLGAGLDAYLDGTVSDRRHRNLLQQASGALGAERCRQIDAQIGLPMLRAALEDLASAGELVDVSIEMLAQVLFSALCEAAMAAGTDPDATNARDQAATVLAAFTRGLRRTSPETSAAPTPR